MMTQKRTTNAILCLAAGLICLPMASPASAQQEPDKRKPQQREPGEKSPADRSNEDEKKKDGKPAQKDESEDKTKRDSEKPARDSEKPARDSEKPARDSEEPARDSEEPARDSEEPARENRKDSPSRNERPGKEADEDKDEGKKRPTQAEKKPDARKDRATERRTARDDEKPETPPRQTADTPSERSERDEPVPPRDRRRERNDRTADKSEPPQDQQKETPGREADANRPATGQPPRDRDRRSVDRERPDTPPTEEDRPRGTPQEPGESTEDERLVKEAADQLRNEVERKKLEIDSSAEAQQLIEEILGRESRLSRAEQSRSRRETRGSERVGPQRRATPDEARRTDVRARERDEAVAFLRRQLRGEQPAGQEPPAFLRGGNRLPPERDRDRNRRPDLPRRDDGRGDRLDARHYHPPHLHDGRRYVRFRSRNDIPAILLAASVLNRVFVQPVRQADYLPPQRPGVAEIVPEPPREYLAPESYLLSYKVDEASMISRDDVLFAQGSTRFADEYSYDLVLALAEAMADPSLANERFVVEGHASAEGSYDLNMELSQRRAERIVRDMVRHGISPDRLVPVGHGESEARYPADAREELRGQDRRVMVFRLGQ